MFIIPSRLRQPSLTLTQHPITSYNVCYTKLLRVFEAIINEDKEVEDIIQEKALSQISDTSFLDDIADKILADNEKSVADFKNGKTNALGFLVGQCIV